MTIDLVFVIFFGLNFALCPCEGNILPPDDGSRFVVLSGATVTIAWKIGPTIPVSDLKIREWAFASGNIVLAEIINDQNVTIKPGNNFNARIDVIKPSTLVLRNVDKRFSGKYSFRIRVGPTLQLYTSEVEVFVAITPMISVDCSRLTTVNTSDDFTCTCKGPGGNPRADVMWYKDGEQIGLPEKEVKTLRLNNVNKTTNGTYRCEAKSHKIAINETETELIVNYPPENVVLMLTKVGNGVSIKCSAEARPSASFKIFLNETKEVASGKELTILKVNSSHVGNYACSAWNILGRKMSAPKYLSLEGPTTQITPTPATSTISTPTASTTISSPTSNGTVPTKTTPTKKKKKLSTGAIVGIIIGVLVLIVIVVVVVVYCCKSKEKERGNRANIDPVPGGNHYELENEEPGAGDGAYDSVRPVGASSSKSKPPAGNTLPPVYAAVDKNNRQGNTLYASLDTDAMQSSRASKKEPDRPLQTEYASIDFAKSANAPKADLV